MDFGIVIVIIIVIVISHSYSNSYSVYIYMCVCVCPIVIVIVIYKYIHNTRHMDWCEIRQLGNNNQGHKVSNCQSSNVNCQLNRFS